MFTKYADLDRTFDDTPPALYHVHSQLKKSMMPFHRLYGRRVPGEGLLNETSSANS